MAADEMLGLVDDDGTDAGSAPRWRVRRDKLRHRATAVLLRDPAGRVYVHLRTPDEDVYPDAHDCWAGGACWPVRTRTWPRCGSSPRSWGCPAWS